MASNAENSDWNILHQGKRVPVNDTGISGAPVALSGVDPDWKDGSINEAVCSTYELTKQFTIDDGLNRRLDLARVRFYINKDMLYGYNGDARGKLPLDQMSFRGYPTIDIITQDLEIVHAFNQSSWNLDGSLGSGLGQFIILKSSISTKYAVPYDVQYTVTLTDEAANTYFTKLVLIQAGNTVPTHYYQTGFEGAGEWVALPLGSIFFSIDSSLFTIDKTFTCSNTDLLQAPYYGTLTSAAVIVLESEYNPAILPVYQSIGLVYATPFLTNVDCYINNCSEIDEELLTNGEAHELFIASGDSLVIGTDVFYDKDLILKVNPGHFLWAVFGYASNGQNIYRINQYMYFDDALGITVIYKNVNGGAPGCYINGGACG